MTLSITFKILPQANQTIDYQPQGKVMFQKRVSVIMLTGAEGLLSVPMFLQWGRVCAPGGMASRGWICLQGVCLPRYWHLVAATEAVDTHPTGMHSCSNINLNSSEPRMKLY